VSPRGSPTKPRVEIWDASTPKAVGIASLHLGFTENFRGHVSFFRLLAQIPVAHAIACDRVRRPSIPTWGTRFRGVAYTIRCTRKLMPPASAGGISERHAHLFHEGKRLPDRLFFRRPTILRQVYHYDSADATLCDAVRIDKPIGRAGKESTSDRVLRGHASVRRDASAAKTRPRLVKRHSSQQNGEIHSEEYTVFLGVFSFEKCIPRRVLNLNTLQEYASQGNVLPTVCSERVLRARVLRYESGAEQECSSGAPGTRCPELPNPPRSVPLVRKTRLTRPCSSGRPGQPPGACCVGCALPLPPAAAPAAPVGRRAAGVAGCGRSRCDGGVAPGGSWQP